MTNNNIIKDCTDFVKMMQERYPGSSIKVALENIQADHISDAALEEFEVVGPNKEAGTCQQFRYVESGINTVICIKTPKEPILTLKAESV